jgi:dipeptidyl aminopeptidase/acylaminoacyl peptidase
LPRKVTTRTEGERCRKKESGTPSHFYAIEPINAICRVACPILLVHGREDRTVPVDDARRISAKRRVAHVCLLEIAGAGHDSTEQIQRYAGEFLGFLEESWAASA